MPSDNFNRPNGPMGSPWVLMDNNLIIVNNQVAGNINGVQNSAFWSAAFLASQFSQATLSTLPSVTDSDSFNESIVVLGSGSPGTGYYLLQGGVNLFIFKELSGVFTQLATVVGSHVLGGVYRFEISTSGVLTGFIDSVQKIQVTDASIISGGPGLSSGGQTSSQGGAWDDWSGDSIQPGGPDSWLSVHRPASLRG